jgi:lysophospholipase L1-like esterase
MKTRLPLLGLVSVALCAPLLSAAPQAAPAPPVPRFEEAIQAFLAADVVQPPPKRAILFVGSSIFRQWSNVAEQMAPLPVVNRAFGGSRTGDLLDRMDQVVLPYEPRIVVYYCGSNDIKGGRPPEATFEGFRAFSERLRAALPQTRLVYVSINRAPEKRDKWDRVDRANQLAREYCAATPLRTYVDVNPALFDAAGEPRLDLFQKDRLHLLPAAYDGFGAILKPVLEAAWAEAQGAPN